MAVVTAIFSQIIQKKNFYGLENLDAVKKNQKVQCNFLHNFTVNIR